MGGLAIPIVTGIVAEEHAVAQRVTKPLVDLIVPDSVQENQLVSSTMSTQCGANATNVPSILKAVSASREVTKKERKLRQAAVCETVKSIRSRVSGTQHLLLDIAGEKGVSSWLTADPSPQCGTVLNKSDFRDAVCLRYGFPLDGVPSSCVCGSSLTADHAMTCPAGGYPIARHNHVRDVVADVMRSAFHDVETEPLLLPFQEEDLSGRTANRSAEARLDIRARGFWTRQQEAFFDIRVTHPKANILSRSDLKKHLDSHEREKKRNYCERVNQVDRGVFTPLVFSTTGLAGRECLIALKNIADAVVEKNIDLRYADVMKHLRSKLAFCILRWNITCFRGCRASYRRNNQSFVNECRLIAAQYYFRSSVFLSSFFLFLTFSLQIQLKRDCLFCLLEDVKNFSFVFSFL